MAFSSTEDIAKLGRYSGGRIRALCVLSWNESLAPWVTATNATILGDGETWGELLPPIDPIAIEAMKSLTQTINHNNTISAGFEKDQVVATLLALHDAGVPMEPEALEGWATANGWSGENPKRLLNYVTDINAGKRPQTRSRIRPDYVDTLRRRADGHVQDGE